MKPFALLLGLLLTAVAVFILLDPADTEADSGPETASVATTDGPRRVRDDRAKTGGAAPVLPIPPAIVEPVEPAAEPVEIEQGEPETGFFGEVLTPTGSGLTDAIVTAYRVEGTSALDARRLRVSEPVHSGAGGVFQIVGLKGGDDYLLTVAHGAFAGVEVRDLSVVEGDLRRVPDIRLQSGSIIFGHVTGPDRKPIDGAIVQAISLTDRKRGIVRQILTNEQGDYRLVGLSPLAYEVAVSADGLETARSSAIVLLQGRAETRFDAQLERGRIIAGLVKTPDGRPLDGVRLSAQRLRGEGPSVGVDTTGKDGRFEIGGLGEGKYTVTLQRNGFIPRTEIGVAADKKNLNVVMVPTVGVSGVVRNADREPIPAFFVRAWKVTAEGRRAQPMSDPRKVRSKDGSYTLDGFAPGTYKVEAFAPGFAPSLSKKFQVKRLYVHGINVRMMKGGALAGTVLDPAGRVVSGATVRLLTNNYRSGPLATMLYDKSSRLARTKTDEAGRFLLDGLTLGTYQIEISKPDRLTVYERDLVVKERRTFEVGPFTLTEGGHLKGTVVDARSVAANGALVMLSTETEGVIRKVRADDDGTFSFRSLVPGPYKITASVTGTSSTTSDDIFTQALRSLKGGTEVVVVEGQTVPVTLYVSF